jgi:hypothetical protein
MLNLSESDLRFLVECVATSRRDYDHIVNLIRDKEDLLELMLEDPKLLERLFHGMCCNFVVESKVGVDDPNLARRNEQAENEAVQ